jgi:hypothetical protein
VNEIDEEVRRMLRERSRDVALRFEVPRSLTTRTRRRIALNALVVGITVVVASVGAFAGLRAVTRTERTGNDGITAPAACRSTQVRTTALMEGAAGAREGAITVANASGQVCALKGTPSIRLLEGGDEITSGVSILQGEPMWKKDALPPPAGWPTVTLEPGDAASVQVRWSNWCPDGRPAPGWRIALADRSIDVDGMQDAFPPPCNGEGRPSTIEVGPFEPAFAD